MIMKDIFVINAINKRIESLKNDLELFERHGGGVFYETTKEEIENLESSLKAMKEEAITVEESVSKDIFKDGEEVDEEFEMWQLGELSGDYQFGTQSWDL